MTGPRIFGAVGSLVEADAPSRGQSVRRYRPDEDEGGVSHDDCTFLNTLGDSKLYQLLEYPAPKGWNWPTKVEPHLADGKCSHRSGEDVTHTDDEASRSFEPAEECNVGI